MQEHAHIDVRINVVVYLCVWAHSGQLPLHSKIRTVMNIKKAIMGLMMLVMTVAFCNESFAASTQKHHHGVHAKK